MRKRSVVVIFVIVVVAIVAAVAMRSHGGVLAGWLPALHGVRGH